MRLTKAKVEAIMKEMIALDKYTKDVAKEPFVVPKINGVTFGHINKVQLSDCGIHVVTDGNVHFYTYDEVIGFGLREGAE